MNNVTNDSWLTIYGPQDVKTKRKLGLPKLPKFRRPEKIRTPQVKVPVLDKVWLQRGLLTLSGVALLAGGAWLIEKFSADTSTAKRTVTSIKIIPDTAPPPPPPPPPKEQPKEQPKEMKVEQPKPQETPPPTPSAELKMEGPAGDGPSPFTAGQVTGDYKGEKIGRKDMSAYAWYTSQIDQSIQDALATEAGIQKGQYKLIVKVWMARDGRVERTELQGSSGDAEIDALIKKALTRMRAIADAPPEDMPQPVKLRIAAKSAG